ncbi:MAG: hypothetical protein HQL11_00610 [Candidatus Omnitrophica bacterium]|nr:hypothetical protein [Candidatus Omnitrophota bacterium]
MTRTIITLSEKDKQWLDRYSRMHGQSLAETMRKAIKLLMGREKSREYESALNKTAGCLKGSKDAVQRVRELRGEWDGR